MGMMRSIIKLGKLEKMHRAESQNSTNTEIYRILIKLWSHLQRMWSNG